MQSRFTLHSIILGAVVLVVVIPVWAGGHHPMWPVSLSTIFVVAAFGILLAAPAAAARVVASPMTGLPRESVSTDGSAEVR